MITRLTRRRGTLAFFALVVVTISILLIVDVKDLCAHSPHDPIDALVISPAYDRDQTLYIAISDHLLKSTNGGSSWKELVNGLDNREPFTSIAIAPSYALDRTVFVSSKGNGIYRSQDGGDSWTNVNNGLDRMSFRVLSIHPDYHSSRVVLAAAADGGLYRTDNSGNNWKQVIDDGIQITALAFFPGTSKDDAIAGDNRGKLYVTQDDGTTWLQSRQITNAGAITSIAISSRFSSDGTFFVGTEKNGVLKTTDGGESFGETNKGLPFTVRQKYATFRTGGEGPPIRRDKKAVLSLALSPEYQTDATVFATLWNQAIFKSNDGGDTWKRYPLGLTCDGQADSEMYKSPHFRAVGISPAFAQDNTVFLGGFDGLFKSIDGGRRWLQMETLPVRLIKGLAVSPGTRDSSSLAIITYGGGAYRTCDQGATWTVSNKNLDRTRLADIVFSPAYGSDNTMLSASKGYILRSTDSGDTWERTKLSYAKDWTTLWRRRVRSILQRRVGIPSFFLKWMLGRLEREDPYATALAVSPNFATDNTFYFGTRLHGVYRSVDGGCSAARVWGGMGRLIRFLAISPDFASDQTLYASVRGMGVYKTIDGGQTWQPANDGLTFIEDGQSMASGHVEDQDIQLAISPNYRVDHTVFAASIEGLYKTTNGGASWQRLEIPVDAGSDHVIGLSVSPEYADDKTLVVSVKGAGLFRTDDGGETFAEIGSRLIDNNHAIEHIVFSASYATDVTIYAASEEGLFLSKDQGATWKAVDRPVRYENHREVVRYEGTWQISTGEDFSASNVSYADTSNSRATLSFVGTGITWIGTRGSDQGVARVYIDGMHVDDVDQFDDARRTMVESFLSTDLVCGPHTIGVEVTGIKNIESSGYRIEIDAFDVLQEQGCR